MIRTVYLRRNPDATDVFLVVWDFRRDYARNRAGRERLSSDVNRCFYIEITLVGVLWTYRLLLMSWNLWRINLCAYMCLLGCRFSLQTHRGGLIKIYDSALMSGVNKYLLLYTFLQIET